MEYNGQVGGRAYHTDFGKQADGSPYVIELGANWIQGLGAELDGGPGKAARDFPHDSFTKSMLENPIWALVRILHFQVVMY